MNDFKLRTTPMAHQLEGVRRARGRPAFAYLMEMGTGKSMTALAEFQERVGAKDIMDLLVIAPKGCIRNWYVDRDENTPSEITKHLDPRLRRDIVIASSAGGAAARDARKAVLAETRMPRALFVHVESLSGSARMLDVCAKFLSRGKAMMIVDESTTIKSRRAQRTKTIVKLGRMAKARRILSGLATPKSPMDLHAQFSFLDPGILGKSFTLFRARYARMQFICRSPNAIVDSQLRRALRSHGRPLSDMEGLHRDDRIALCYALGGWIPETAPMIAGYQRLTELRDIIAPHCYRVRKEDCLDLPPKVYEWRDVEMTDEQRRVYKEILEDATSRLAKDSHVTTKNVVDQILRLHQVCCGHVGTEDGTVVDVPSKRIDTLLEVLGDHDGKAIVWVAYDRELRKMSDALTEEYGAAAVARYWGGNAKEREEDERRFLTDPQCRFMLSTPAAGGMGNNWTVADLVVYGANNWNLEHRAQSEDRAHRRGQTKSVTYIDIGIPGTVEEKIIWSLRSKMDLASTVTGESLRRWLVPPARQQA